MEKQGGYCVAPVLEQVFLVFLDIHELVNNMHLDVKLFSIDSVLAWRVEMVLDPPCSKIVIQVTLLVEQVDSFSSHEIIAIVQWHLVRGPRPVIFFDVVDIVLVLMLIIPIAVRDAVKVWMVGWVSIERDR